MFLYPEAVLFPMGEGVDVSTFLTIYNSYEEDDNFISHHFLCCDVMWYRL